MANLWELDRCSKCCNKLLVTLEYCIVHYVIIEERHLFPLESNTMLTFLLLTSVYRIIDVMSFSLDSKHNVT